MTWLLLIHQYLPDAVGGNIVYIKRFAEALALRGHRVDILTTTNDRSLPLKEQIRPGLTLLRVFSSRGSLGPLRFGQRRKFRRAVRDLIENNHYHIVNIHSAQVLGGSLPDRDGNQQVIATFHCSHAYELFYDLKKSLGRGWLPLADWVKFPLKWAAQYWLEYRMLKRSDRIVVLSLYIRDLTGRLFPKKFLRKMIRSSMGVSPIIPGKTIDKTGARMNLNLSDTDAVFITVRRLVPRMGIANLIQAFQMLKPGNERLIIIGEGILKESMQKMVTHFGLEDRIKLLGFVDNSDLHQYYCSADCFILPTEELEGFGIVTLEALSYGLPVIATPVGATPEILAHFDKDLITASHRAESICEKIQYFTTRARSYAEKNHREKAAVLYDWDRIIADLTRALRESDRNTPPA